MTSRKQKTNFVGAQVGDLIIYHGPVAQIQKDDGDGKFCLITKVDLYGIEVEWLCVEAMHNRDKWGRFFAFDEYGPARTWDWSWELVK